MADEPISKLPAVFDEAVKSGDVFFFPSTVNKHVESGIEVSALAIFLDEVAFNIIFTLVRNPSLPCAPREAQNQSFKRSET
jgi:hypothetical protein